MIMSRIKMFKFCFIAIFYQCISLQICAIDSQFIGTESKVSVDDLEGVDRVFDGIGAISGGGATSKLLMNYAEPYRSQVLDFLFKPGFGASLQILKVEIGGDSQSTDGSESSHMHTADDQNYNRGYEWWLMVEAKKRNPDIKLYGLPWTWPGWVGGGVFKPFIDPDVAAFYIVNWVEGALKYHNLTIDYLGVWNERDCDPKYVKVLRKTLNMRGFSKIKLVSPDAMWWGVLDDFRADPDYAAVVDIIGQHYPAASCPAEALNTGKILWCSEEFSAYNDLAGGGCWARVLTESFVNARYTGFIAWNLITSYYDGLPYTRSSLMTANQPWSGHYEIMSPIWMSAHHTHFYQPGWHYLKPNHGVGNLTGNGTYVALTNPDHTQLTIVISTVDPRSAGCFYGMPKFSVADKESISIQLGGSFKSIEKLYAWYSFLDFKGSSSVFFEKLAPVKIINGSLQVEMERNQVLTITTLDTGEKGDCGTPPASKPFPVPYKDDFENYPLGAEPFNLAQQSGSFEIQDSHDTAHGQVVVQTVTQPPVDTCLPERMTRPVALIGDYAWKDVHVEVDVMLDSGKTSSHGAFIGSQLDTGGCWTMYANGFHFWVNIDNMTAWITGNHTGTMVYASTKISSITYNKWFTMGFVVQGNLLTATLNHEKVLSIAVQHVPSPHGFVAVGPLNFGVAYFDNINILHADVSKDYVPGKNGVRKDFNLAEWSHSRYQNSV